MPVAGISQGMSVNKLLFVAFLTEKLLDGALYVGKITRSLIRSAKLLIFQ